MRSTVGTVSLQALVQAAHSVGVVEEKAQMFPAVGPLLRPHWAYCLLQALMQLTVWLFDWHMVGLAKLPERQEVPQVERSKLTTQGGGVLEVVVGEGGLGRESAHWPPPATFKRGMQVTEGKAQGTNVWGHVIPVQTVGVEVSTVAEIVRAASTFTAE